MKYLYQQTVRLDETIADKLRKSATRNKRSMNSEIVAILDAYFLDKDTLSNKEVANTLRRLANFLDENESGND